MNYAEVGLGLDLSQSHSLLPLSLNVFPAECLNQAKTWEAACNLFLRTHVPDHIPGQPQRRVAYLSWVLGSPEGWVQVSFLVSAWVPGRYFGLSGQTLQLPGILGTCAQNFPFVCDADHRGSPPEGTTLPPSTSSSFTYMPSGAGEIPTAWLNPPIERVTPTFSMGFFFHICSLLPWRDMKNVTDSMG